MSQIKPTQIIPSRQIRPIPGVSLPVDLNPVQRNLYLDPVTTVSNPEVDSGIGSGGSESTLTDNGSPESVLEQEDLPPSVPAIIGVKEQIIKFMPDGTAKIDVILEVQDVENAVEYDIRIAKDAGNI